MSHLTVFASIAMIHVLAIASPGPTLVVVTSQAVTGSRRSGFLSVLGVVLATLLWSSAAAAGLGGLVSQIGWLYLTLKIIGAAWIGFGLLRNFFRRDPVALVADRPLVTGWRAVRAGFVTTMSNPKVAAYYTSLFGVVIPADAAKPIFVGAVVTAVLVSALWWSAVTLLFGFDSVRNAYVRSRRWVDGVMGALLLALAGRLLVSR